MHVDIQPLAEGAAGVAERTGVLRRAIHDLAERAVGAAHGIGTERTDDLRQLTALTAPSNSATMRAIGQALDPLGG